LSKPSNKFPLASFLVIVIVILSFLSLLIGPTKLSAAKVFSSLFMSGDPNIFSIIWQVRVPRLLLSLVYGIIIAIAGSIFLGIQGSNFFDNKIIRFYYGLSAAITAIAMIMITSGSKLNISFYGLLGSLYGATWNKIIATSIFAILGIGVSILYSKDLNALLFGEYTAKTLGIEVQRTRAILFAFALILSVALVYFCGMLCLTGLIIPYFVRLIAGVNFKYLIPVSMLTGAAVILFLDIFSRIIFPSELPIGIIIMIVLGPLYIYALRRRRLGL